MNTIYSLYFHFAANMKMNTVQMKMLLRELRYVDMSSNVLIFFHTTTFCCESTCEILTGPAVHYNYPNKVHILIGSRKDSAKLLFRKSPRITFLTVNTHSLSLFWKQLCTETKLCATIKRSCQFCY